MAAGRKNSKVFCIVSPELFVSPGLLETWVVEFPILADRRRSGGEQRDPSAVTRGRAIHLAFEEV